MSLFSMFRTLAPKMLSRRTFNMLSGKVKPESSFCCAVIAAAGNSQRCGGEDKLFYEIGGKPVLAHTIYPFQRCSLVRDIIVVTRAEQLEAVAGMCSKYGLDKVSQIITGGETRTDSVYNGVFAVPSKAKLIAIHDGARPCIDLELIEKTIRSAAKYHAAAPGVPVASTIKRTGECSQGDYGRTVLETIDRENLIEIQTPQIFRAEVIKAALQDAVSGSLVLTDDCKAVENIGVPVHIVEGDRRNIKITERTDLLVAKALLC